VSAPLVSAVMPARDAERFVAEAIESVLAQTYAPCELLVVDDGSRDGTRAIAERYAAAHPGRVRVLEHPGGANLGISASRNLGVREARGALVAFLDADDVWLPHKLAEQVPLLLAQPAAGLLYGNMRYWFGWTGRAEDAAREVVYPLGVPTHTLLEPPSLLTRMLRREAILPGTCSVLVRRDALLRVGGAEARFRTMHEDQAMYAKLLLEVSAYAVDTCGELYRQHPDSTVAVAKRRDEVRAAERAYLDWLAGYVAARGVRDRALLAALAAARRHNRHPWLRPAVRRGRHIARRLAALLAAPWRAVNPSAPAP
jgi:glycosyltransferase involved in cell wall biosynthesis